MTIECPKCQFDNPNDTAFCGKCGTNFDIDKGLTKTLETPTEELTTGSTFAERYQIIEELGKGGMGRVYKVLDKETNEKIALKLIKPEIATDKKTIERFRNELTTARKIVQKNVCRMFDLNKEKDNYYITMEFVSGGDLKRFIRRSEQLSVGKAISIAKQICEGLAEAHSLGIVHRDLKPSNIMIDDNGNARIMDFGIARTIRSKGITGSGVMIGTPEYMSPEQVEAKDIDQRSDIYSLGIILYEMLTGRLPFEADTPFAIGVKHKSEIPKDPKEFNPQIPDDLSSVILKCLEKGKESRHQSADALRSELNNIEKGLPTTDRAVPRKRPLTSREFTVQFSIKKLFIPAFAVIAIAVIGLIIWSPWKQRVTAPFLPDKNSIAVLPFADLSSQKDQEILCDGMTVEIITKLSKIKGWNVINTASAMRFKNTKKDVKDIGQELNVTTILFGSVRKEADDLRVDVQLVNVDDRFQIWGDTYQQKLTRIFDIQSSIAEKVVRALKAKISPEEEERLQKRPTDNLDAYNLYLTGRWFWEKRTEEGLKKAIEFFDQAIQLNPNYGTGHQWYANYFSYMGQHEEAVNEAKRARELDPLSPIINQNVGRRLYFARQYDQAIEEIKKALQIEPNFFPSHRVLGLAYLAKGMYPEAIEELEKAVDLSGGSLDPLVRLGYAYAVTGNDERALEIMNDIKNQSIEGDTYSFDQAIIFIGLGKKDLAIKFLEKAYEERSSAFYYLKVHPFFDPLRQDPRFTALLKKVGLE